MRTKLQITVFLLAACFYSPFAYSGSGKYFDRVVFVVFENTEYYKTIRQPFFKKLVDQGAHFSNFFALARPSQPNYIALTSGTTAGVKTNKNVDLDITNIVDLLERAGLTWRVYAQGYPGNCYTAAKNKRYVRKHNPFISYVNVQRDPERCAKIVDANQFLADVNSGNLPNYSFFVPDNNNNAHNTDIAYANRWYEKAFGQLIENPSFMKDMVLVTTFDEGSFSNTKNQIYTSIIGPNVNSVKIDEKLNLYSLLKLVEDNWQLGNLGREDAKAPEIPNIWKTDRRE